MTGEILTIRLHNLPNCLSQAFEEESAEFGKMSLTEQNSVEIVPNRVLPSLAKSPLILSHFPLYVPCPCPVSTTKKRLYLFNVIYGILN